MTELKIEMENLLTIAVLLPLAAAFLLFLFPANKPGAIRALAILATGTSLALTLYIFSQFDRHNSGYQFVTNAGHGIEWLPSLGVTLKFGVDGISMTLLLLVGIVSFCAALVSHEIHDRQKAYYILFLALTTGISGTFCTTDMFFFYFFYEMAVIPMYLLIGMFGSLPPGKHGRTKEYATMKLTLYLTAGAVLALIGLLAMYFAGGRTFDMMELKTNLHLAGATQKWIFACLLFGFGFLASMWPFHTWSPIGYAAAPTAASMMHAGVLKKLGAYGIIRLALPLLPEGARHWANLLAILACFNILYAGWAALTQKDWKFVIGYSSVSHMGYVLLGIATLNVIGVSGAVLLMFAHGVMAALTFSLIGFFYHQTHNRMVPDLSGLARKIPFIGVCMVMAVMASSGLPGFANFASEVMVFIGAWSQGTLVFRVATICAIWGIVVTATYLLWAVRTSFFGPFDPKWNMLKDATTPWQRLPYVLLIAVLLTVGFSPRLLTDIIQTSVAAALPTVAVTPAAEVRQ